MRHNTIRDTAKRYTVFYKEPRTEVFNNFRLRLLLRGLRKNSINIWLPNLHFRLAKEDVSKKVVQSSRINQ